MSAISNVPIYFNPRLREGGDVQGSDKDGKRDRFQSTPPRRRRPILHIMSLVLKIISIHASAKEATSQMLVPAILFKISIHASAKEATSLQFLHLLSYKFQSTPPRRRRPQHIVIPQPSCTYIVLATFLSAIFSFISQYVVLFFLF